MDTPEDKIREVVEACADCDCCRPPMDPPCLVFQELYRLHDAEKASGIPLTSLELRNLVDLCNYCALCPCPNIREDIIEAKTRFIARDGLKPGIRLLEDIGRLGRLCGTFPALSNRLLRGKLTGGAIRRYAGIDPASEIPEIPKRSFDAWTKSEALTVRPDSGGDRKVAYFAGCTGRYLFPEVPRAAVEVLRHNHIPVHFPEQACCGMPPLLEGDRDLTLKFARDNIAGLSELVEDGWDIVATCPTCVYMLRIVITRGAYYSSQYQDTVGEDPSQLRVPANGKTGRSGFTRLQKNIYGSIFRDDGYFSAISPMDRIRVAEATYDLGEYLRLLHAEGRLDLNFNLPAERIVYYPPCHLREQDIGSPYLDLMKMIPGLAVEAIDGRLSCCGMAGIMGFKNHFRASSIRIGTPLMEKIRQMDPEGLATDCLSCRLQFNRLIPYPVRHPIEILWKAYGGAGEDA